ncbi:LytR/AlgR family response regulator transcription factor [Lactiplantibacillus herbarum]|uniref:LytR/AlgR family response regulator transcription factor n=1 Tax=Lactiplantibacillus herbarum TaxID=1670446 RepID=UPI00064F1F43|nr:LytTR family DNA-binding domain-containing protein [Lactiplantibacillus herbarum]
MFNIVICEDDLKTLNLYTLIIKNYIADHPTTDIKLVTASQNPNIITQNYRSSPNEHFIYFLDVEFANSTIRGIDLAANIRSTDIDAKIIFITVHDEFQPSIINEKIEAFDFIYKESGFDNIASSIILDLNRITAASSQPAQGDYFTYRAGFRDYRINLNKIDYFEALTNTHHIQVVTASEIAEFRGTLTQIATDYPKFFLAHKGILVNLDNIESINSLTGTITFKDQLSCIVSRRRIHSLRKTFTQSN